MRLQLAGSKAPLALRPSLSKGLPEYLIINIRDSLFHYVGTSLRCELILARILTICNIKQTFESKHLFKL
jgi:hypothetical protein